MRESAPGQRPGLVVHPALGAREQEPQRTRDLARQLVRGPARTQRDQAEEGVPGGRERHLPKLLLTGVTWLPGHGWWRRRWSMFAWATRRCGASSRGRA